MGRDPSFALGNQPLGAQEFGQQLGARNLVGGTTQRVKNEIIVDIQLVDTCDGVIAWGARFSRKASDLPGLQRAIAIKIGATVRVSMRETEKLAASGRVPQSGLHGRPVVLPPLK